MLKTKSYDMFKFRNDNREGVNQKNLERLIEAIKSCNLLDLSPIIVNEQMEIIQGQHRLLAAKHLNLDIYYIVKKDFKPEDIITLNASKAWTAGDHLNFYIKNGYPEYQKLDKFIKESNITLKVALSICMGEGTGKTELFKKGKFVFENETSKEQLDICWNTIEYIKKMNGFGTYLTTAKFFKALIKLVQHHQFNLEKWNRNLHKMVLRIEAKISAKDYLEMFMQIYNWGSSEKVNFLDDIKSVKGVEI